MNIKAIFIISCIFGLFFFTLAPAGQLLYSTYLGGIGNDACNKLVVDSAGNCYLTGLTNSTTMFPSTVGAYDTSFNGDEDVFVAKFNTNLSGESSLIYATFIGGIGEEYGTGIAVDITGNAYITGVVWDSDFPTTSGAFDTTSNGSYDIFVTKLNTAGSNLVYSTFFGSSATEQAPKIAIDTAGNAYVVGWTAGHIPTSPGAFDTTYSGSDDGFAFKLNATGSALVYSTFLGGSSPDISSNIAVDNSGNAYITGRTKSSNYYHNTTGYDTTYNGDWDAFVCKLNNTGTALVYFTFLGGTSIDYGERIAIDAANNAYITGFTASTNYPTTPGAYDVTHNGSYDIYIAKLDASGTNLIYSTFFGGSNIEYGEGIALDAAKEIYITGYTQSSTSFPITADAYSSTFNGGNYDSFLSKFDSIGSTLLYSTFLGGSGNDSGVSIALDSTPNIYIGGWTYSSDFPITALNAFDATFNGTTSGPDAFISKFYLGPIRYTEVERPLWMLYDEK
jgi:hypothetical protein